MSLKIVVLAKQVPDTRNVGKDAMTADGTINRAALPAIFNPEDLNALEQATGHLQEPTLWPPHTPWPQPSAKSANMTSSSEEGRQSTATPHR